MMFCLSSRESRLSFPFSATAAQPASRRKQDSGQVRVPPAVHAAGYAPACRYFLHSSFQAFFHTGGLLWLPSTLNACQTSNLLPASGPFSWDCYYPTPQATGAVSAPRPPESRELQPCLFLAVSAGSLGHAKGTPAIPAATWWLTTLLYPQIFLAV